MKKNEGDRKHRRGISMLFINTVVIKKRENKITLILSTSASISSFVYISPLNLRSIFLSYFCRIRHTVCAISSHDFTDSELVRSSRYHKHELMWVMYSFVDSFFLVDWSSPPSPFLLPLFRCAGFQIQGEMLYLVGMVGVLVFGVSVHATINSK